MIASQNNRTVVLLGPGTLPTNATATARVDTLGYDYATVTVLQGPATATNSSARWASLFFSHGDSTSSTAATNIASLVGSTTTAATSGFVIAANNNTSTGIAQRFGIDLRGKGRYLFFSGQPHATNNNVAVVCELSRAEVSPSTDAQRGVGVSALG